MRLKKTLKAHFLTFLTSASWGCRLSEIREPSVGRRDNGCRQNLADLITVTRVWERLPANDLNMSRT